MDRESAERHLREHMKNENLIKHCLAVEAAMRAMARRLGQDEGVWGITGLVHDIDYEEHPDPAAHGLKGADLLAGLGYPEEIVKAVRCHNPAHRIVRESVLDKGLYAVDELTGFISAVALVRPSKKIADVEVKSVTKKFKDKAFARQVDREGIRVGAEELGLPMDEHVAVVLDAMKGIAERIDLERPRRG